MSVGDRLDREEWRPRDRSSREKPSWARALAGYGAGLTPAVAVLLAVLAMAALGGCASTKEPATPFGAPPTAAPGVRAWAAGEVGALLVTADGGATWARQRFYLSERSMGVVFPDARDGWLITDAGAVLATTNGGKGWDVVVKDRVQLNAVAATDAEHAWVLGSTVTASGETGTSLVLSTADGGHTWSRTGFGDAMLSDVVFADPRHGLLVALDRVWSTHDGGHHWKLRRRVGMAVLTSAAAGDAHHFWVAGWDTQNGSPFVLETENGGATWRRLSIDVPAPSPGALQAREIAAAGGGLAGGAWAGTHLWITCSAGVLASQDSGKTWTLQRVAAGQPQAIAAADDQHLIATTVGQPILATADGGATWPAYGRGGLLQQPLVAVSAAKTASP